MALTTVKSDQIQTSVALAGSPTTTTQSASDNSTKVATTAYVETAVANLVASAPAALNTLDELAAALNDDASFSTTVTNSIATKLPLAGGTMTGNLILTGSNTGTNPAANGHISNELRFYNSSNTDNNLDGIGFYNSSNAVDARIAGVHKSQSSRHGELAFLVHDGSALTERVRITYDGNVGIGETSPQGNLHVRSADSGATADGGANELVVEGSGNTGISILSGASSSGAMYFGDSGSAYDGYISYDQTNHKFNFATNSSPKMYIDTSGNVGIGVPTPDQKLMVKGTIETVATNSANGWMLYTYTDNTFRVNYNGAGADEVTIDTSGNVGIGTSPISLTGNADPGLTISSNGPYILLQDANNANNVRYISCLLYTSPSPRDRG